MNVLFTCAGRRNYLLHYFRETLAGAGRVFAADARSDAPALAEADRGFIVPPVNSDHYIDRLIEICRSESVDVVIPLNDLELPSLAHSIDLFASEGIRIVISNPEVIETCFDKWKTIEFLTNCGLQTPRTTLTLEEAKTALLGKEIRFPLVVKPRWGSASIGIEFPEDHRELELAYELARLKLERSILAEASKADRDRAILIQEKLRGQEYGLDIVNDLDGNHVTTIVKRKLGMRAGETDRAVTVFDERLIALGRTIGEKLRHVGNLDCDVFVDNTSAYVLEMNPRFGGGYPFSHEAGSNLPRAILAWARGECTDPLWFQVQPDIITAKCDRLVQVATPSCKTIHV